MESLVRTSFQWGFHPLDVTARHSFFSQNAQLPEKSVCTDFEENQNSTPIDLKAMIAYNFSTTEIFFHFLFIALFWLMRASI